VPSSTRRPTRVERAFAGVYGKADTPRLRAAVGSDGPAVAAADHSLSVAWTGPPASAPPRAGPLACLLDGEIYNLEHIAQLAQVPSTVGAEAVLARAYGRLGEQFLTYLRGEFALLIWDARSRAGLLARDQLGSGNIFVHATAGGLIFASELRHLLDALPRTPGPYRPAVAQWLAEGTVPDERTLYEGVVSTPPACLLRLRDGRWETIRYWTPRYVEPRPLDLDQAAGELRGAVFGTVGRRLGGRRTAGVLVSGGLDSGTVLAAATRAAEGSEPSLRTYSAVFPDHRSMDESELIDLQVEHHGLPDVRFPVTGGSPLRAALGYLDRWRVPLPVPGHFIWEPLLAAAARDAAECMLDGEAGDELFGAAALLIADRLRAGRLRGALQLARSLPGVGVSPSRRLLAVLLAHYGVAPCLPRDLARLARPREHPPWWLSSIEARSHLRSVEPHPWRRLDGPRWWAQLTDAVTQGPDRLGFFDYFRRRGRAVGMPAQHPFLDLDLIETVLRLPPEHGFHPSLSRPLLRQAMRGLVPEAVRIRQGKSYFDSLVITCLAVDDREHLRRLLTARDAEVFGFADRVGVRALVEGKPDAHPCGAASWMRDVWRLVTAECWLRSLSDRGFAQGLLTEPPVPAYGRSAGSGQRKERARRSYVSPP
jgi:asparagine synthase (glutamine-hydrolysing)